MRKPPLCILCAVVLIAHAGASTVQVSHDLQAAIDAASPGDTLLVAPGVYDRITVTKSLSIIGNGSVIRAGSRDACVSIGADGVTFSGFLVRDGFYGIKLDGVRGCRIANNTVVHCTQPGIALLYSDENTIIGNNASFNGLGGEGWYGIYLSNSNDNVIAENVAFGNGAYGINLFPSCSNNTIRDNVLQGNMYGLYMFTDCSDNLIENNDISQNTNSGLDLRFNCTGNQILNNTIQGNVVAGITLMDSGRNTIAGNDITGNRRYGLQVQGRSDENLIFHNIISESQTGIFVESSGNRIYGNRILDNILQSEDRGRNTWYAPYPEGGNLWSDYLGSDEMSGEDQDLPGSDGFGDEPYIIGERSRDIYPVMGGQVQQISILGSSLSRQSARVGDSIEVEARLQSRYALSSVTVRALGASGGEQGYARLLPSGDMYQGTFSTALLDPGRYDLILSAKDLRGYELKESIGEIELAPRGGFA